MGTGYIGRNERRKRKADSNRAKGLCLLCSTKAKKDRVFCDKHLKINSQRQKKWRAGDTKEMEKITMKNIAEDKIKAKCSECGERAAALYGTVAFCSYHAKRR